MSGLGPFCQDETLKVLEEASAAVRLEEMLNLVSG